MWITSRIEFLYESVKMKWNYNIIMMEYFNMKFFFFFRFFVMRDDSLFLCYHYWVNMSMSWRHDAMAEGRKLSPSLQYLKCLLFNS